MENSKVTNILAFALVIISASFSEAQQAYPQFLDQIRQARLRIETDFISAFETIPAVRRRIENERARQQRQEEDKKTYTRQFIKLADAVKNPCRLRYVWGHGGDTKRVVEQFDDDSYVGLGCMVRKLGTVPGIADQAGYNGGWYGNLDSSSNGGFNPTLSMEGAVFRNADPQKFKESELRFIEKQTGVKDFREGSENLVVRQVTSVGFMRLATHSWFALLNQAFHRIENRCEKVHIEFICSSDSTHSNYGTAAWQQRILDSKNASLYSEAERRKIGFAQKVCAQIPQNNAAPAVIWSVPQKCGETIEIDQYAMTLLKREACGKSISRSPVLD